MTGDIANSLASILDLPDKYNLDYRWCNFDDGAAIAWGYLVGKELGIPSEIILKTTFQHQVDSYIYLFENCRRFSPYFDSLFCTKLINDIESNNLTKYIQD